MTWHVMVPWDSTEVVSRRLPQVPGWVLANLSHSFTCMRPAENSRKARRGFVTTVEWSWPLSTGLDLHYFSVVFQKHASNLLIPEKRTYTRTHFNPYKLMYRNVLRIVAPVNTHHIMQSSETSLKGTRCSPKDNYMHYEHDVLTV